MSEKKHIRVGIELNHVMRNINKQIAKFYQKDFDDTIDLDELDYKDDILHEVCHFGSDEEVVDFLYSEYPYEVFGEAPECDRMLSRDVNFWIKDMLNQEEYDVEVFYYSMKEFDLTIQSSLFFLSRIGARVREVRMPRNYDELHELGDVFITADPKVAQFKDKGKIVIKNNFNQEAVKNADLVYESMRDFLNEDKKLEKVTECLKEKNNNQESHGLWTWIISHLSFLVLKLKIR